MRINVHGDVAAKGVTAGWERYRFVNNALPEIDLASVDLSTEFIGYTLRAPLLISCMTGGTPEARRINRTLAVVAEKYGLAMGLGSGRALLEGVTPSSSRGDENATLATFEVRDLAPNVPILANLGAVQLRKGYGTAECQRLLELLRADALVLHLNAVQEALQPEGDTCFSGLLHAIAQLCSELDAPVIVKEVGWGIDAATAHALTDAGAYAIDVAGAGGTSWSEVERYRLEQPWRANVAHEFASWGIPTADAIAQARAALPSAKLIASGGISTGMDLAKAIALGADLGGIAGPFLRAADQSEERASDFAREVIETLRIAMFAIGARNIDDLRNTHRLER